MTGEPVPPGEPPPEGLTPRPGSTRRKKGPPVPKLNEMPGPMAPPRKPDPPAGPPPGHLASKMASSLAADHAQHTPHNGKAGGGGGGGGGGDEEEPPSNEDVESMMAHLGMDLVEDAALRWIAEEAYDAPLPDGWAEHFDWEGKVYFYNKETDTVMRDHPLDDFYRQLYAEYKKQGGVMPRKGQRAPGQADPAAVAAAATGDTAVYAATDTYKSALEVEKARREQTEMALDVVTKALGTLSGQAPGTALPGTAHGMPDMMGNGHMGMVPGGMPPMGGGMGMGPGMPMAAPPPLPAQPRLPEDLPQEAVQAILARAMEQDAAAIEALNDITLAAALGKGVSVDEMKETVGQALSGDAGAVVALTAATRGGLKQQHQHHATLQYQHQQYANWQKQQVQLQLPPEMQKAMEANTEMVEVLKGKLEAAEQDARRAQAQAEEERSRAAITAMQSKLEKAQSEAAAARAEAEAEREKADRVMAKAMEAAAAAGKAVNDEENERLWELQQQLLAREREAAEARDALEAERQKSQGHAEANRRIEAVLQDMKEGQGEAHSRLALYQEQLAQKEREAQLVQEQLKLQMERQKTEAEAGAQAKLEELRRMFEEEKKRYAEEMRRKESEHRQAVAEQQAAQQVAQKAAAKQALSSRHLETVLRSAKELKAAQVQMKDDMGKLQLYLFNKLGQAAQAFAPMFQFTQRDGEQLRALQSAVNDCEERIGPLIREKRRLFNELLTAKGNIRVFCRVRPSNDAELAQHGGSAAVSYPSDDGASRMISAGSSEASKKNFEFDRVFQPSCSQEDVFTDVQPLIQAVMDGWNVCVFAYGQTGSGKTHTMEGPLEDRGVTFRSFNELFKLAQEAWGAYRYEFKVSILEIYNEQINDLLVRKGTDKAKHDIKTDEAGLVYVTDLTMATALSPDDFGSLMQLASKNRSTGATKMNERSSRSHLVMVIHVLMHNSVKNETKVSKLSLIDLAGSERQDKTGATGDRLKESLHINKSLSALGDVIASLTSKKGHVPFRNSKLTHLLSDSLGNDSKTLLFVNCSPSISNVSETSCSLQFAARARNVDLSSGGAGVRRWKEVASAANKVQAQAEGRLQEYQGRIAGLEEELARERKGGEEVRRAADAALSSQKAASKHQADQAKTIGSLEARVGELKTYSQKCSDENEKLRREVEGLREWGRQAAGAMQAMQAEVARLRAAADPSSSQQVIALKGQLAQKEKELETLKAHGGGAGKKKDGEDDDENKRLKQQMLALTDINKQLLDKCKVAKLDKQRLEDEMAKRDQKLAALQLKHSTLLKKYGEHKSSKASPGAHADDSGRGGSGGSDKAADAAMKRVNSVYGPRKK